MATGNCQYTQQTTTKLPLAQNLVWGFFSFADAFEHSGAPASFQRLMDKVPFLYRNNRYLLVIQNYFTKWAEAIPLLDQTVDQITKDLTKVFTTFGVPDILHSNQGGILKVLYSAKPWIHLESRN